MSVALVINGTTYDYPETGDNDWGPEATDWAAAVTSGMLQKAGGLFQLLAEVDFGTAFGVKSLYLKSRTASPASSGQIRLAKTDVISFRNNAGDGNLSIGISASDVLQFNGVDVQSAIAVSDTSTIDLTLAGVTVSADIIAGSITNSLINASAAIAYSKLNLSGSIVNADVNAAAAIAYSKLALTGSIVNADVNASAAIAYSKLALTGTIVNADVSVSAAIAYSKLALTNSILNADINSAAAIAYSKLALSNSIVNADINSAAAIAYSKLALTGGIVNADISASAAIAFSKLATLSSANILVGSAGNVATSVAVTGDVTISNAGVTAIGANKVVNSMLAQMAQSTVKGRAAGAGTGDPVDLTATQATAILNNMVGDSGAGGTKGLVPAPAAGDAAANKFLKADGSWASTAGSGDVVGPGSATDNAVARFDTTTGKLLQNSVVIVGDTGNVTGVANLTVTGTTTLDTGLTGVVKAVSGLISAATLVNADVSSSAAIAYSKLNLTGTIVNADVSASAAIAYSKLTLTGSIVNADVNASAAIAYSKLTLTGSIVNADVNASAAIAYSKLTLTGSIVNADVNASAAIAFSKLASLTSAHILVGSAGNVATDVAVTGDISLTNGGVTAYSGTVPTNKGGTSLTSAGTSGNLLISNGTDWVSAAYNEPFMARNYSIAASVSSNALTITLNNAAGSQPSSASPVQVAFRSTTNATGTFSTGTATGATTVVISSGSTLGFLSGGTYNLWVYAINNAGTIELGTSMTLFDTSVVLSSTAEGGAGAADSNNVIYSTTTRANVAMRVIAKMVISEATAGTWVSVPTVISCQYYDSPLAFDPILLYATNVAGTTIDNTSPVMPFASTQYDTHNTWTSNNLFTAPVAGKYKVSCGLYFTVNNSTAQGAQILPIVATTTIGGPFFPGVGASNTFGPQFSRTFSLTAGQTVQVKGYSDVSTTLNTGAGRNFINIERVG